MHGQSIAPFSLLEQWQATLCFLFHLSLDPTSTENRRLFIGLTQSSSLFNETETTLSDKSGDATDKHISSLVDISSPSFFCSCKTNREKSTVRLFIVGKKTSKRKKKQPQTSQWSLLFTEPKYFFSCSRKMNIKIVCGPKIKHRRTTPSTNKEKHRSFSHRDEWKLVWILWTRLMDPLEQDLSNSETKSCRCVVERSSFESSARPMASLTKSLLHLPRQQANQRFSYDKWKVTSDETRTEMSDNVIIEMSCGQ